MPRFSNSLMIGATGMLHDAAAWAAERSERLVLVSREAGQSALAALHNVVAVSADWRRPDAFVDAISDADAFAGVQLAVLWIHGNGSEAKRRVEHALAGQDCLIVDVQGSIALADLKAAERPGRGLGAKARSITVTLGAVRTGTGQRWLTWEEISAGVSGDGGQDWARTVCRWTPSPSIPSSTTSPAARYCGGLKPWPTPGGVPVEMMSPGCRVMKSDR